MSSKRLQNIKQRVAALDWPQIAAILDANAFGIMKSVLSPEECVSLAATYESDELFRSRIVMARHNFGRGEYKYFN